MKPFNFQHFQLFQRPASYSRSPLLAGKLPPAMVADRLPGVMLAIGVAAALTACGGGSSGSSDSAAAANGAAVTDTSGAATVAVGPISGFGSVIVNGVKYDDSSATVSGDDGQQLSRSDMRLGMTLVISGSSNSSTATGVARAIAVSSELKGVVQNRTANDFQLLGITVRTSADTVFENASDVVNGDFVEVYGVFDATSRTLTATRVERKPFAEHKLRGTVSNLDTTNRRFTLGSQLIDYNNAGNVSGLSNGSQVRVTGAAPANAGVWSVSRVRAVDAISLSSVSRVELKAAVEQFNSIANFRIAGLTVDGSNAVIERGVAAQVAVGTRLQVKGDVQAGIVRATRIKIEDGASGSASNSSSSSASSSSSSASSSASEFEVKGTISQFVSLANFVVRGTRVDGSGLGVFEPSSSGASVAAIANGACVEVKGVLSATASGSAVRATRIKLDNDCL